MKSSFKVIRIAQAIFLLSSIYVPVKGIDSLFIALESHIDMVVAADGSGDFITVQEAIDAVPASNSTPIRIYIRNGYYYEKILIPEGKSKITLIGQNVDSTILDYDDYSGKIVDGVEIGTSTSYSFALDADNFTALNLTFSNSAGAIAQAVALRTRGDYQAFLHCRLIGYQDTYYTWGDGRNYLKDCYIEGATDYIFGRTTTVFDSCSIHSLRANSYITAASTEEDVDFGYVFFNCRLTADIGKAGIYLGRPWRANAKTVFFECEEGGFVNSNGWSIWNGNLNHETCFYAEYKCFGLGSDTLNRVSWSHQLTDQQAAEYTLSTIFSNNTSPHFSADWLPDFNSNFFYQQVKKYSTMFMDSINFNTHLNSIRVNGSEIEDFDPLRRHYVVELPTGTEEVPELDAVLSDSLANLTIQTPNSIPRTASFLVIARDGATNASYEVYLSVDSAYTDATLKELKVDYVDVPNFQPDIYEYDVTVPYGTTSAPKIQAYTNVFGAYRVITQPETPEGTGTVKVTAVDGSTQALYVLNFSLGSVAINSSSEEDVIHVSNPFIHHLVLRFPSGILMPSQFELFNMNGGKVFSQTYDASESENGILKIDAGSLTEGIYIYRFKLDENVYSGKIVKRN